MSQPKKNPFEELKKLPVWAWCGVIACGIIPFLTLGGAVPAGIGFTGAWGCCHVAKQTQWSKTTRIILVIIISIMTWVIFLLFVFLIAGAMNQ